jgi:hypothetical protein
LPRYGTPPYLVAMPVSVEQQLETIGFGGDGDQVDAFLALERHFGVVIDDTDCGAWRTAGDVFDALLNAMSTEQRCRSSNWSEFAAIMCEETGADATRLGRNTLLLALPLSFTVSRWLKNVLRRLR